MTLSHTSAIYRLPGWTDKFSKGIFGDCSVFRAKNSEVAHGMARLLIQSNGNKRLAALYGIIVFFNKYFNVCTRLRFSPCSLFIYRISRAREK